MGHDITAYIRTKSTSKTGKETVRKSSKKAAYFRIGAFTPDRADIFYGMLPKSLPANAGVSGNGDTIIFDIEEIKQAKAACEYFKTDPDALKVWFQSRHSDHDLEKVKQSHEARKQFAGFLGQMLGVDGSKILDGMEAQEEGYDSSANIDTDSDAVVETLNDTIEFYSDIIKAFNASPKAYEVAIEYC